MERYKSEKDRRIVKLGLTKQGKVIFSAHEAFHKNLVDAMIEDPFRRRTGCCIKSNVESERFC